MKLNKKNEKMQRKLLKRIAVGAGVATLLAGTAAIMWAKHTRCKESLSVVKAVWGIEERPIRTIGVVIPEDDPRRNMGVMGGDYRPRRNMGDNFAE